MKKEEQKKVFVFDFDGTLTFKDSMIGIIKWHKGTWGLLWALLRELPLLLRMVFIDKSENQHAKEVLLNYCFGAMYREDLSELCQKYADENGDIIDPDTYSIMLKAKAEGHIVEVITASPKIWVEKFIPKGIEVLGTELEYDDRGRFTGRFTTPNCYGQEKVNRLLAACPNIRLNRLDYHITAFGDSRGDQEMLDFADVGIKIKK